MKNRNTRRPSKSFLLCVAAAAFVGLAQTAARADEVLLVGQTSGCFGAGCQPLQQTAPGGLTYQGSFFGGVTQNGFRGLGGIRPAPATPNFNNLGLFTLNNVDATYDGTQFTLQVSFFAPQGFLGPNGALLSATLTGSVRQVPNGDGGGVFIDFDNTPTLFTFIDYVCEGFSPGLELPGQQIAFGRGQFYFSLNDLAIEQGKIVVFAG